MATYIIRAGEHGPVKIGRAENVEERLAELQTGNPAKLTVLRIIDSAFDAEPRFHQRFRHLRIRGEWFHFDPEMLIFTPEEYPAVEFNPDAGFGPALVQIGARRVARDLGVNERTIRNWIDGSSAPSFVHVVAMLNHPTYAGLVLTALGRPDLVNPKEMIERELADLERAIRERKRPGRESQ